jgi:uncharacterized protein involved in cysteine biosynthesis
MNQTLLKRSLIHLLKQFTRLTDEQVALVLNKIFSAMIRLIDYFENENDRYEKDIKSKRNSGRSF